MFVLAAHFADRHSGESACVRRAGGRVSPGTERAVRLGGEVTRAGSPAGPARLDPEIELHPAGRVLELDFGRSG